MAAGNTYTAFATQTLGSAASSVTFSSISGAYTDLVLVCNGKATTGTAGLGLQFNADTSGGGTNYSTTILEGSGAAAASERYASTFNIRIGWNAYWDTTYEGNNIAHIMNYANTTTNKTVLARSNNAARYTEAMVGLWRSTAAISTVTVIATGGPNFDTGSTFTLYGISCA